MWEINIFCHHVYAILSIRCTAAQCVFKTFSLVYINTCCISWRTLSIQVSLQCKISTFLRHQWLALSSQQHQTSPFSVWPVHHYLRSLPVLSMVIYHHLQTLMMRTEPMHKYIQTMNTDSVLCMVIMLFLPLTKPPSDMGCLVAAKSALMNFQLSAVSTNKLLYFHSHMFILLHTITVVLT